MKKAHELPDIIVSNNYFETIDSKPRALANYLIENKYIVDADDVEALAKYLAERIENPVQKESKHDD